MSGVLDRMVERTRGMLPAAEPRIAASGSLRGEAAFTAVPAADDWQGEVVVERESSAGARAVRRWPPPADPSDVPEEVRTRISAADRAGQPLSKDAADERPQAAAVAGPMQPQGILAQASRVPAEEALEVRRIRQEPARPPQEPAVERVYEAHTGVARQSAKPVPRPSFDEAPAVSGNGPEVSRADTEDRSQTIHEHREITISIGRISMEAAPLPAVRTPAAFRPRVSLDAFLQGRQGGRR